MQKTLDKERMGLSAAEQEAISEGASQAGIGVILALATLIGAWGIACLVGGIGNSGGIMAMARGWLTAVTGM